MLRITRDIALDDRELEERFVRASGPGGQNVNKVSTAVQLRFNVFASPSLPDEVRARLVTLAGKQLSAEGDLIVNAQRFRTQARNRADARDKLAALIRAAAHRPKPRRKTRPSAAAKRRRLEAKRRQGETKRRRSGRLDLN